MTIQLRQALLAARAKESAEQKVIQLSGKSTTYWFYPARTKRKNSRAIVFIHGYRGNHHGLEAIVGAIEHSDVYIPDLPGFGQSESFTSEHSINNYANWLNDFLLGLKLKQKPHLLGHSFGSILVSAYAARYRGIETLILENPVASPALKGPKAFMTAIAKGFFWLAGALPESAGDSILKSWPMVRGMSIVMTKSRNGQLRKWVHRQHDDNFNDYAKRRVALEGYAASISSCVSDFVETFEVPVLMLIGERDDITSVHQQQQLFARLPIPGSELKIFEGVGHLTHYEVPEQIAAAIEDWVLRHA
ncbi:MAG: alpha/beta fold hydrolase [Micrococcales bacterium]